MIDRKIIKTCPITYEDFLPVSAAGIFQSNLDQGDTININRSPNQQAFERDFGCPVIDEFEWYARMQRDSLINCLKQLGMKEHRQAVIVNDNR